MSFFLKILACLSAGLISILAKDQPQWGEAWSRNMISGEENIPAEFDPHSRKNLRWMAELGTETHSTPVIADGRVYIGTNNGVPRDPRHEGDRGVLMCFDEESGEFLWQLIVPKRSEDPYLDWPNSGISSPVTVDGGRVYVVSNRGEVLCLDPKGLANGNDGPFLDEASHQTPNGNPPLPTGPKDADILWAFDMTEGAGIWSHDGAHSSILVHGRFLYLNTGTGVDNTHRKIRTPDAPSLIVLDKFTGRYVAREQEKIAPNIFHCTWSSPSLGKVDGRELIFFAGGNGVIYAFEPLSQDYRSTKLGALKKVWAIDFDPTAPKEDVHRYVQNRRESPSNIFGMPVFLEDSIYVAGGGDLWWGKNEAWIKRFDASGSGKLIWSAPLEKHTMSTPAIRKNLVFVTDTGRWLRCLDRQTGKEYWNHELRGELWASAYVADDKVYLGSRRGDFWVFAASEEKKPLFEIDLKSPISATAVAANQTLYIATMTHLYAVRKD